MPNPIPSKQPTGIHKKKSYTRKRVTKTNTPEYTELGRLITYLKKSGYKVRWHKPLAKGIYDQLRSIVPDSLISSRKLYRALGHHVHSVRYLTRMKAGDNRFNIHGEREGRVTKSDEKYAKKQLVEHHSKTGVIKRLK